MHPTGMYKAEGPTLVFDFQQPPASKELCDSYRVSPLLPRE
jgi:hypothetical protein